MKIHKLVLLSSVLILPTQELLAGNARNLAQTAASKSTVVAPAQATVNSKVVAPSRIEATSSANETPVSPPPSSTPLELGPDRLAPEPGKLKTVEPGSDVTVKAILSDSCRCDLRDVQAVSGEGLKVVIRNIGRGTAKNIIVTVSYYRLIDRSRKVYTKTRVEDLQPHETRTIYMTPAAYLTGTGTEFIATVEASNDSNLSNNRFTSVGCSTNYIE